MRIVIVGNSAAAIGAIEAIRQHDTTSEIVVISDEPYPAYSRPLISYLLGGLVNEEQMLYRPVDFYQRYQVETMLGTRAVAVHTDQQAVELVGGSMVTYDQLLIATGGKPFIPPMDGVNLKGVFTFTRWEDARRIERMIEDHGARSALVIGGGLIGLKATEALLARGIQVTMVELADHVLGVSLDAVASSIVEALLQREGVAVRTGTTAQSIVGRNGAVDHAVLRGGEIVPCDMVIIAIGVRPNVEIVMPSQRTGIEVNRGILVDRTMRTSVPNVYAAGDCVEAYDMLLDQDRVIAIWPNAYRQGAVAGSNIVGVPRTYDGGFPMNSVSVGDVPIISVGITDPKETDEYEIITHYDRDAMVYKKFVLQGNYLVGAILVGAVDRAGIYTGLIRDRRDVSSFKDHLLAGNFGLISLPKTYRQTMTLEAALTM